MTQDDLKSAIKKIQAKINRSLANGELSENVKDLRLEYKRLTKMLEEYDSNE